MKPYELRVSDLMSTALITVEADEPVGEARADMELGSIRHLPVLDHGKLVGIVSDRDLIRSRKRPTRVREVMSRDLVTTRPQSPAHTAASLMLDHRIGSVPVVDDNGALVGMVTLTDYVEVARRALLGISLER